MCKKYSPYQKDLFLFYGIMIVIFIAAVMYCVVSEKNIWGFLLLMMIYLFFILSVTVKEYRITDENFLEIRFFFAPLVKPRKIAISDIVSVKKTDTNRLRIDTSRSFETLKVKESELTDMINELKLRNPDIQMYTS